MKQSQETTPEFQWDMDVPLLTNRFILYDLVKLVTITGLIFFVLMTGMTLAVDGRLSLATLALWGKVAVVLTLGLLVLLVLVMLLFFLNRFPMRFTLTPKGAQVESLSRRGKWGNRLAVFLGAAAGRPQVAGAGLLGMAQETVAVRWPEVRRYNIHAGSRVISLMNNWRVVFRLYCTPENFPAVKAAVQKWAGEGQRKGRRAVR